METSSIEHKPCNLYIFYVLPDDIFRQYSEYKHTFQKSPCTPLPTITFNAILRPSDQSTSGAVPGRDSNPRGVILDIGTTATTTSLTATTPNLWWNTTYFNFLGEQKNSIK